MERPDEPEAVAAADKEHFGLLGSGDRIGKGVETLGRDTQRAEYATNALGAGGLVSHGVRREMHRPGIADQLDEGVASVFERRVSVDARATEQQKIHGHDRDSFAG